MNNLEQYFLKVINEPNIGLYSKIINNKLGFLRKYNFDIKNDDDHSDTFVVYFNNEIIGSIRNVTENTMRFGYFYQKFHIEYTYEEFIQKIATNFKKAIVKNVNSLALLK